MAPESQPKREIFLLDRAGVDYVISQVGRDLLEDAGILDPID